MSSKSKESKDSIEDDSSQERKTCFIIMPISDHDNYLPGHFDRVYQHIIKPACELAGFRAIRADDVKTTNYIALDIIKQIIESDMAICDLSSQNPNVLYEVGIRQAFNLPVTFIKDTCTKRIFDIQGFRDVPYDETLRIDTVEKTVLDLSDVLSNTHANEHEVNSLVTLLGIQPAKLSHTKISVDTDLILNAIKGLEYRVAKTEHRTQTKFEIPFNPVPKPANSHRITPEEHANIKEGQHVYHEKFGMGTIKETKFSSNGYSAYIIFGSLGIKHLILKFAPLWLIEE